MTSHCCITTVLYYCSSTAVFYYTVAILQDECNRKCLFTCLSFIKVKHLPGCHGYLSADQEVPAAPEPAGPEPHPDLQLDPTSRPGSQRPCLGLRLHSNISSTAPDRSGPGPPSEVSPGLHRPFWVTAEDDKNATIFTTFYNHLMRK